MLQFCRLCQKMQSKSHRLERCIPVKTLASDFEKTCELYTGLKALDQRHFVNCAYTYLCTKLALTADRNIFLLLCVSFPAN